MTTVLNGVVLNGTNVEFTTPAALFAAGEQGAWYDPSDMSTMFQDSAGTTPVTAVEQPVGRINDKSGNGNNATQSTDANRPVLSARVNLLTKTQELNDSAWTRTNLTATDGATDPNGENTAETLTATSANGTCTQSLTAVAASHIFSIWLRRKTGTGNVDITCHSGGTWVTQSITSSWAQYTVTQTLTAGTRTPGIRIVTSGNEVEAWGADLRVANDGVGLPPYQRVNTSTDYNTVGFPMYLRFDGSNDSLSTGSINFTSTDKMSVFAGWRKIVESNYAVLCELSATSDTNNGSFLITQAANFPTQTGRYSTTLRGTQNTRYEPQTFTAPLTNVVTLSYDIGGAARVNEVIPRFNGEVNQTNPLGNANAGTGNFGNYPLYVGARNNASLWANGRMYSLIVRGASSTSAQIAQTEAWVNSKTRAY